MSKKIDITNIDELLIFLKAKWEFITHQQFTDIIRQTMGAYANGKPDTLEHAIYLINTHWEFIKGIPLEDRPLFFIEQENEEWDVTKHLKIFTKC